MKKLLFLFFALFFLAVKPVFAGNDLIITCASGGTCTKSSDLPLFQENNIYPGYLKSQNVTVINNRQKDCNLKFKAILKDVPSSILPEKIMISITKGANVWYSGNLQNATAAAGNILGTVLGGATDLYLWTASFNKDAGNSYQNTNTTFDLDFNFECEDEVPTPTSIPSPSGEGTGGQGNPSPPVCSDIAPASAPVLTSAVAGTNSVTLFWNEAGGPLTYYLIAFGTQSGVPLYGNPNIGGPGTTSYIVNNLSAGQLYYFKVRAGNGCMPGPFSNELSAVPLGTSLAVGVPLGFQPGVLGKETEEEGGELNGGVSSEEGTLVEGAKTEKVCPFWWIVLLGQTVLLGGFYALLLKRKEPPKHWWLVVPALVILAYLIDRYAHTHWYVPSQMCPWEKWLGIGLASLETIGYRKLRKKTS